MPEKVSFPISRSFFLYYSTISVCIIKLRPSPSLVILCACRSRRNTYHVYIYATVTSNYWYLISYPWRRSHFKHALVISRSSCPTCADIVYYYACYYIMPACMSHHCDSSIDNQNTYDLTGVGHFWRSGSFLPALHTPLVDQPSATHMKLRLCQLHILYTAPKGQSLSSTTSSNLIELISPCSRIITLQ